MKFNAYSFIKRAAKIAAAVSVFTLAGFVFAEENSSSENQADKVWEETKKDAKAVGAFFSRKAKELDKKIQSNLKTACTGKWTFTNADCTTIILCNSDGTMNIRMDKENNIRLWKGLYESTKNEISFHITVYNERINGEEKFDSLHEETWSFNYRVRDTEEMTLTSEKMEADLNGYSFKNPTVFSRVK